jgi:hypothetical protein
MKKAVLIQSTTSQLLSTKAAKFNAKQYERPGLSEDEVT